MLDGLHRNYYGVIYADPPWRFVTYSARGQGRSADNHYATMTRDDLRDLPVHDLAARDCVLLMWSSAPFLTQSLELIEHWRFAYRTVAFYWLKTTRHNGPLHTGLGYWTRSNVEFVLLATCGNPKRVGKGVHEVVVAPRRAHSRKPDLYGRIEELCRGPYCELFSREQPPGWDVAGDQVGEFARYDLFAERRI